MAAHRLHRALRTRLSAPPARNPLDRLVAHAHPAAASAASWTVEGKLQAPTTLRGKARIAAATTAADTCVVATQGQGATAWTSPLLMRRQMLGGCTAITITTTTLQAHTATTMPAHCPSCRPHSRTPSHGHHRRPSKALCWRARHALACSLLPTRRVEVGAARPHPRHQRPSRPLRTNMETLTAAANALRRPRRHPRRPHRSPKRQTAQPPPPPNGPPPGGGMTHNAAQRTMRGGEGAATRSRPLRRRSWWGARTLRRSSGEPRGGGARQVSATYQRCLSEQTPSP